MIELRILGSLHVSASDGRDVERLVSYAKRTALLAYLAAARPRGPQRRDTLLALFWPESDAPHARAALNQALYVLRTVLGDGVLVPRGDGEVGLNHEVVRCDACAFEAALDAGRHADALALYRGDLLEGFFIAGAPEFERWLDRERARLRERASEGAWALAEARAAAGNLVEAERWARQAAGFLPADEAVVRRLMTFLSRLGDRAAASRAYETFAVRLADEYELEPSPETRALVAAIREEERAVRPVARAALAPAPREPARRPRRAIAPLLVGVALAAVIGTAIFRLGIGHGATPRVPRILVLPFQNLGAVGDAYFADGVTDEITTRLATVDGLQVIGGQAALRYKGTTKPPRQIAAELGVDYILGGTVSWERVRHGPGRVRVRPQLTSAHDDTHVWAAVLDQNMTEIFPLLSGIAQTVVDELHVVLEQREQHELTKVPTTNLAAYDDYLRGRALGRGTWSASTNLAAIQMFERAVARDSQFALAWARLSFSHTEAYWLNELGPEHLDRAKGAADRALRLDPNLPDAHVALGHYYYACCADYERALQHLETAHAARPGDAQVVMLIGNVHKRRGNWKDAIRYYERAAGLDPRWDTPLLNLGQLHLWLRHYEEAERVSRQALALEPREAFAYGIWGSVPLLRDGDITAARRVMAEAASLSDGYRGITLPFTIELFDRRPRLALEQASTSAPAGWAWDDWLLTDHLRKAVALRVLGNSVAARQQFDSARVELEARLPEALARSRRAYNIVGSALAIAYAGLQRRPDALKVADVVLSSDPPAVDAINGPVALQNLAVAYLLLDEKSAALDIAERLVSIPSSFSPPLLRLDPLWDPLRGDPRFERLVRGTS